MKEPLQGTRYNTRDEHISAIGQSIRRVVFKTFGKRWYKRGATILKIHKCCTSVNKTMSGISNCCQYFYATLNTYLHIHFIEIIYTCMLTRDTYYLYKNERVHRCGTGGSMRTCHAAGPGSVPVRDRSPGWGFSGFSSPVRQNVRKL